MNIQEQITKEASLQNLREAVLAEKRITKYAKYLDDYGLDVVIGLLPVIGDIATSIVSGFYLLYEADKVNLLIRDRIKIVVIQIIDIFIGMIPIDLSQILNSVVDYMFKANKICLKIFKKRKQELIVFAKNMGASEEEIEKALEK